MTFHCVVFTQAGIYLNYAKSKREIKFLAKLAKDWWCGGALHQSCLILIINPEFEQTTTKHHENRIMGPLD